MLNISIHNAFNDNYLFLLTCAETGEIAVIDPGDADVIIEALDGKKLGKILMTHKHYDHVGGVEALVEKYGCEVLAFEGDKNCIPCITTLLKDDEIVQIGQSSAKVMHVPGHTTGHLAYYFTDEKAVFVGDVLFVGGCGKLVEGTATNMFNSLVKLSTLPNDTNVYCAHEYTVNNLEFAAQNFSDDKNIVESLELAKQRRLKGKRMVPSTIGAEKEHNVFIRAKNVKEFTRLRALKDAF